MPLENPFQDALRFERRIPECAVAIFGANGDLTKRKLLPALYRLAYERRLAPGFAVVGISRTPLSDDQFRANMRESVAKYLEDSPFDEDVWSTFAQGLYYMAGDIGDPEAYTNLAASLKQIEECRHTAGNVLFYLSTQPSQYATAAKGIGAAGLAQGKGWRRIVIEKPFGHDLASARELSNELHEVFRESDIYRIDHYLGKETVQNILAFRFGNGIFEPLWDRRYVNSVQITAAESIGVEGRGGYYQEAGALRDMIQNHLLQIMATIAMEPSATFQPDAVRDERAKLLRTVRVMKPDEVLANSVSGQYGPARIGGADVPGFRQEKGRGPAIANGHLCGGDVLRGQLALGGRAVLYSLGQTAAQAGDRNCHSVRRRAACGVRRQRRRGHAEPLDPAHSARGRNLAAFPIEAAGRGHEVAAGLDGFQLRIEFRRAVAHRIRNAAAGRNDRRRNAVHAAGHGGGELGRGGADPERVAKP